MKKRCKSHKPKAPNNEKAYTTTKFTPKGITWVAGEWGKYKLAKGQA